LDFDQKLDNRKFGRKLKFALMSEFGKEAICYKMKLEGKVSEFATTIAKGKLESSTLSFPKINTEWQI